MIELMKVRSKTEPAAATEKYTTGTRLLLRQSSATGAMMQEKAKKIGVESPAVNTQNCEMILEAMNGAYMVRE